MKAISIIVVIATAIVMLVLAGCATDRIRPVEGTASITPDGSRSSIESVQVQLFGIQIGK